MRWWGLALIVLLGGGIFAIGYFYSDPWLEEQLEYAAGSANGAKVEIDGFELALFSGRIRSERIQITNSKKTMENIVEFGENTFAFDVWALVFGHFVVDDFIINDFRMNTPRKTDGALPLEVEEEPSEPGYLGEFMGDLQADVAQSADVKLDAVKTKLNVDSLVSMANLQAPARVDSAKKALQEKYDKWESKLNDKNLTQPIADLGKDLKEIDPKKIKDPRDIKKTIETVQNARKTIEEIKTTATSLQKDIRADLKGTTDVLKKVDDWVEQDFAQARSLAKLPDFSAQSIGTAVFGPALVTQLQTYLGYLQMARDFLASSEEEEAVEELRIEGEDVKFSDKYEWPTWWIKNIDLSGATNTGMSLAGNLKNMTSGPKQIGLPLSFSFDGADKDGRELKVNGAFNRHLAMPGEELLASMANIPLTGLKFEKTSVLPYPLKSGLGKVKAELSANPVEFNTAIRFDAADIGFDFTPAKDRVQRMIQNAVASAKELNFEADIKRRKSERLTMTLRSNLDDLLMRSIRQTIQKEVDEAKRRLRKEVESRVADKRKELENLIASKQEAILGKAGSIEELAQSRLNLADDKKKELEERLKKALEGKAKDLLKNAFDFER